MNRLIIVNVLLVTLIVAAAVFLFAPINDKNIKDNKDVIVISLIVSIVSLLVYRNTIGTTTTGYTTFNKDSIQTSSVASSF